MGTRISLAVLAVACLAARPAAAQRESQFVVRTYDLSDRLPAGPPYPARHASDFGERDRPMFPAPAPKASGSPMNPARTSLDRLIDTITSTITPSEWAGAGGPASISALGNSLVVSANEDTHEKVDTLIKSIPKQPSPSRIVSLEAHWLWLTDDELGDLLVRPPGIPVIGWLLGRRAEPSVSSPVNETEWSRLIAQRVETEDDRGGYRAVVTCYNGQTVHTTSGGQRVAVTRMVPAFGGGGDDDDDPPALAYQPTTSVLQEGAALQVTPVCSPKAEYVELDVHSRVVQVRPARRPDEPPAGPAEAVVDAIDRPVILQQRLSTTLRLPVSRRVLIGGMTFEGGPIPGDRALYLFVRASVQEIRDSLPPPK